MSTQSIRPSQFITTYGPGAIIEGKNGPRLIPSPDIGLFKDPDLILEDYEISDARLSEGILHGARVFRLPSNAELGKKEDIPLYRTKVFPSWNLCVNSNHHNSQSPEDVYILYHSSQQRCPVCSEMTTKNRQAVRFIVACPEGHLDDFDWDYFIHDGKKQCNNHTSFMWKGGGSSLSNIFLYCPECNNKSKSMEHAYKSSWPCHGRFPEREELRDHSPWKTCNARARIIQRQASNLRIVDIVSLFTIPPRDTALHRMLDNQLLRSHIQTETFADKIQFENRLRALEQKKFIKTETVNAILGCTWEEITQAINDLDRPPASTYRELILEELNELLKASTEGAPAIHRPKPSTTILFEVDKNKVTKFKDGNGRTLIATPINKLSEIAVQTSYRREIRRENPSKMGATPVDVSFVNDNKEKWYPGMELHGEGIFISTEDGVLPNLKGDRIKEWKNAYESPTKYDPNLFRDDKYRDELHPFFVYFHTLSHLIIRSISANSGYSSSALRERIYLDINGPKPRGGFLIYATQPGSDGTSGGLISLVNSFQQIYDTATNSALSCSNDPLCIEDYFSADGLRVNGSCCYGCTLISETSCEHRNLWLDRGLVLEDRLDKS
ncbi:MAG: DUF1998 domain-containing protein [Thermoplasmatales archaeon]